MGHPLVKPNLRLHSRVPISAPLVFSGLNFGHPYGWREKAHTVDGQNSAPAGMDETLKIEKHKIVGSPTPTTICCEMDIGPKKSLTVTQFRDQWK